MKRAILYARVSSDDRDKDGRNLNSQLDMCRKYAKERKYSIVAELSEDEAGASGASLDLLQLTKAREMALNGEFDILVARELDRLSRKLAKQLIIEEELNRAGVSVEYVLGEYPDTPEGNLNKQIKAVVAEYERLKITERMSRGSRNKVKAGSVLVYGHAPYGYKEVKRDRMWALEIHEPEAKIVRLVYELYVGGSGTYEPMSIYAIAQKLNEMGVPTYSQARNRKHPKTKNRWSTSTIHFMLRNEVYKGKWHFGKRRNSRNPNPRKHWLPVDVPPIVDKGFWEMAQARLLENKQNSPRNLKYKEEYLMRQKVKCGNCGITSGCRPQQSNKKYRKYHYYKCLASLNRKDYIHECSMPLFRADHIDSQIWTWVSGLLMYPENLREHFRQYQQQAVEVHRPLFDRLEVVESLIADYRNQLEEVLDLYLHGDFNRDILIDRKVRIEKTISNLEIERETIKRQIEAATHTKDQLKNAEEFTSKIAVGLDFAQADFDLRKKIVDLLGVQAITAIEDDAKVFYASCFIGECGPVAINDVRSKDKADVISCVQDHKRNRDVPQGQPGSSFASSIQPGF